MADCECLPGCPFFNDKMVNMPVMAEMFKNRYCRGDASGCARYMVFKAKGRDAVPGDLFPTMVERAKGILGR